MPPNQKQAQNIPIKNTFFNSNRILKPLVEQAEMAYRCSCMKAQIDNAGLLEALGYITPLPESFQQRLNDQIRDEYHPIKKIILSSGDIARKIYYIKKGFLRAYFLDQNGREHTSWFVRANELMTSGLSFFTQSPSEEFIEVLQESHLQSLTWHQLQSYYADFREGNLIGRIIAQNYYLFSEQRLRLLRTRSLQQRYQILLKNHPNIEQLTSTANIASYLGINRETFSRMRSQLVKKNS